MLRERAPLGTHPHTRTGRSTVTRGSACWLMTHPRDRITADHTADRSNAILQVRLPPGYFRPETRADGTSYQRSPDHLQRLLGRKPADTLAVAGKVALHDLGSFFSGERHVHQADRLLLGSPVGRPLP